MKITHHYKKITSILIVVFLLAGNTPAPQEAEAATFSIQTGSYVGDGTDNRAITGLGFQPDLILLKDHTSNGSEGSLLKTSSMAGELTLTLAETDPNLAANHIQSLDADGFTVGNDADVNAANEMYFYIAIGGSDCSSSGTFCVGSYTGNGTSQGITSVGFQPDMVAVKNSSGTVGVWKSSSMSGTETSYFHNANPLASQGITSLDASGFSIGSNMAVNISGNTHYYFAFKEVSGFFDVGTYTGNAVDGRDITSTDDPGLTFQPDAVFIKGAFSSVQGFVTLREHYGAQSFFMTDVNSSGGLIRKLLASGGFQIGSTYVNQNGSIYYYMAFGGAPPHNTDASGTYTMAQGVYTGTGSAFSLTGLGFAPDLVIIKGDLTQHGVFRTSLMAGSTRTAYMANASGDFTYGIYSLDSDGFSLGPAEGGATPVNDFSSSDFYWTAFGNAQRIDRAGGASDFMVGQYIGTGDDNQDVRGLGMAPDFVFIKRADSSSASVFRTNDQIGDAALFLYADEEDANLIQSLNSDGFQKGTDTQVNSSTGTYDYFMFKKSDRFETGTYTGTGSAQNITTLKAQPDYLWVKKISGGTDRQGIFRTSEATGDWAISFLNIASFTTRITNLIKNGFSIGTGVESNENTFTYQYVAWNNKHYEQQAYRWFENADSTDVGSALATQDNPATMTDILDPFRLRMLVRVDDGNLFQNAENFDLQFAEKVGTCDTSFSGETYADVSPTSDIRWYNNATPSGNTTLTPNANDPTDGLRTIANQSYNESNPVTTSTSSVLKGQTAQFDFSLIAKPGMINTPYCFRLVYTDSGTPLDTYNVIPEIITGDGEALPSQTLSFSISDNSIGFGTLSSSASRYATDDGLGLGIETSAHTLNASTNATNGYAITFKGETLTCTNCLGSATIDAIGAVATGPNPGTEQFGVRAGVSSGTGSVSSPYDTVDFAFDTTGMPSTIITGLGDEVDTEYQLYYLANSTSNTDAGNYESRITYTMTAQF